MVQAFCPQCGKVQATAKLCSECTKKKSLDEGYEAPLIQVSEFNREFYKGSWHRFEDIEEVIIKRVQEALGKDVPIIIPGFEFTPRPKEKIKFTVFAVINETEVPLPVRLSYMQCDYGQKQKTAYYEGILQLREPHEQVIEFINNEMQHLAPKGVFITKTVDQKNGVDLYFTNKTQMHLLAQKIGAKFGAQVSSHPQLFSRNHMTSKDIYRLNVLVTLPSFLAGDVISFEYPRKGTVTVLVKSMGKIMQGIDLNLQKNVGFELKNCDDITVYKKKKTTISSIHPQIGILDPETFQEEYPIHTEHMVFELGQEVNVVKTPSGLYIVD